MLAPSLALGIRSRYHLLRSVEVLSQRGLCLGDRLENLDLNTERDVLKVSWWVSNKARVNFIV